MVIVAAKRTPFGTYGGKLKDHTATDLAEIASKAAILSAKVSPDKIDSVIIGNVIQVMQNDILSSVVAIETALCIVSSVS